LLGETSEPAFGPLIDLNMMVMLTGRERTLDEYRALIETAGFHVSEVIPIRSPMAVIEAPRKCTLMKDTQLTACGVLGGDDLQWAESAD
jgi:O-methyltransferase domain